MLSAELLCKRKLISEVAALPALEEPVTVRLHFCKKGSLQFISHLDLQRSMMRIFRRAGLPLWYTQGYNPHPKLVFAAPLSVGTESVCELMDVRLVKKVPVTVLTELLNMELTSEMYVLEAYYPIEKFTSIVSADYRVELFAPGLRGKRKEVGDFLAQKPFVLDKRTKSGVKATDISPMILAAEVREDAEKTVLLLRLGASPESFLNPELILTALREKFSVLSDTETEFYTVRREAFRRTDGEKFR